MNKIKLQQKSKVRDSYIIHYSCEGFYDGGVVAPVVCAIALLNYKTGELHTFALHNYIIQGKSFVESEQLLLRDFIDFYKNLDKPFFIHWSMDGLVYGFKAIYARAVNFGFYDFDLAKLEDFNLSEVVELNLIRSLERNNCKKITVLSGKEEAVCFNKRDFDIVKLSTEGKTFGMADLFEKYLSDELVNNLVYDE